MPSGAIARLIVSGTVPLLPTSKLAVVLWPTGTLPRLIDAGSTGECGAPR